jgi:hypothetical protein
LWSIVAEVARMEWRIDDARKALEEGFAALAHSDDADRIERELVTVEARLWLALGLPDLASEPLSRLRRLTDAAPSEERAEAEELATRLEVSMGLATERFDEVIARLEGTRTSLSQWLRLSLASAYAERSRTTGAYPCEAIRMLEELVPCDSSHPDVASAAGLRLAEIRLRLGETDACRALIETWAGAIRDPNERLRCEALQARLELAEHAPADVLESRSSTLRASFDDLIDARAEIGLRSGGVGLLHFLDVRGALSELIELARRLSGDAAALDVLLGVQEAGSLARSLGSDPATLASIRSHLLAPGGGLLAYLPGAERSHVFLIDAEDVLCEELPPLCTWNPDRSSLQRMLQRPPSSDEEVEERGRIDELLGRLSEVLLPPSVQDRLLRWSEVAVEGLGLAGNVPFEALPLADGRVLGTFLPVSHLPSLVTGTRLAARERSASLPPEVDVDLALLAAPDDVERESIPWSSSNERSLSKWCRSGRFVAHVGADATPERLHSPAVLGASWLLLVLHGIYDAQRERPSGFLLGRDEDGGQVKLFAEDVEQLRVPPLVFLAVCGAGRGTTRRGDDGITDLGGAFLRAGADAVVLSSVDLAFEPTIEVVGAFQRELARGATASQALHRARVALASDPRYDHPFFYGQLHLVGIGHRPAYAGPLLEVGSRSGWWIAAGLILAGLGGLWVNRSSGSVRSSA